MAEVVADRAKMLHDNVGKNDEEEEEKGGGGGGGGGSKKEINTYSSSRHYSPSSLQGRG